MRLTKSFVFTLLTISILSYGLDGSAFADSHDILPVSVSISDPLPLYAAGDEITITGNLKNYDAADGYGLTFVVSSSNNPRIHIGQPVPNSDGSFEVRFIVGGNLWNVNGEYTIEFHYNSNIGTAVINYNGAAGPSTTLDNDPPEFDISGNTRDFVTNLELGDVYSAGTIQNIFDESDTSTSVTGTSSVDTNTAGEYTVTYRVTDSENNYAEITETVRVAGSAPPPPPPPPPTTPPVEPSTDPVCGPGTELVDGICQVVSTTPPSPPPTNGCLIATAAYGTELAPQVQLLREVRDNTLMSTSSGITFMSGFNEFYYAFSPAIADMERESPVFRQAVQAFITPMISTLPIMSLADDGSEFDVLGLGISVIALNLGMYIAAPALIGFQVHKYFKSRKH